MTKNTDMQYVRLGNTWLQVSRLCLGCMTYGSKKWREWVLDAVGALSLTLDEEELKQLSEPYRPHRILGRS